MTHIKLATANNPAETIFPLKEILSRLGLKKRNTIDANNGIQPGDKNLDFAVQMKAAQSIMHDDRDVLKKLAE